MSQFLTVVLLVAYAGLFGAAVGDALRRRRMDWLAAIVLLPGLGVLFWLVRKIADHVRSGV